MQRKEISLLYPKHIETAYQQMSEVALHDMGIDTLVSGVTNKEAEQTMFLRVLSKMTDDAKVAKYRTDIFEDIMNSPKMCEDMMKLLDKINFLKDYGTFKKKYDEAAGIWDLMHRLEEMSEYISYVDAMHTCLAEADLKSEGLLMLKNYVADIYEDNGYGALKKDVEAMKASTQDLKSVTLGINLNERFEVKEIGLISVNNKPFTKSNVIGNFYDKMKQKGQIHDSTNWDGSMKFQPVKADQDETVGFNEETVRIAAAGMNLPMAAQVASVPAGDITEGITRYMDRVANHMLSVVVKSLRETLNKYMTVTITDITNLIPEFVFYMKFAEYIKKYSKGGLTFCKAQIVEDEADDWKMEAKGLYNLKLLPQAEKKEIEIVTNDLSFEKDKLVYILTGANRGGKTTVTQAVGQLFVLAQAGIYVPADSFVCRPVDCIFTHFPADEDQTLDLGRLGEECKRFKELYLKASPKSLVLLNETFSTTSFEEGYFIARDSVRAILNKGIRTLYNTHMHKLAFEIESLHDEQSKGKAVSLVARASETNASFKMEIMPPEGMSYAKTIAEKYGVTFEMLTNCVKFSKKT